MVAEAEKYKEEDDKAKARVEARNSLESFSFQVKQTLDDEKLKDKFSEEEKETLTTKADEMIIKSSNNNFEYTILRPSNIIGPSMTNQTQENVENTFSNIIKPTPMNNVKPT